MPEQTPTPSPKKPLVIASGMTRSDFTTAALILVVILGFVGAAIYSTGTAKNPNMLNGEIREKYKSGEQSRDITVSAERGSRGISDKIVDSGCYVKVYVTSLNKTYDVMLAESEWERKKVGDRLDFLRPASERQ
jgi:hypothetical protein